jgi:hypothetical protein
MDGEVSEVIAGLCLIPMRFERGANQVHPIARLCFDEIGMDRGKKSLITERSGSGLDMGNQLRGVFSTGLS